MAITNKDQIAKWIEDHGIDSDFVKVRVLGEFPEAADNQLISSDLVRSAFERIYRPSEFDAAAKIRASTWPASAGTPAQSGCVKGWERDASTRRRGIDTMTFADIIAKLIAEHSPDAVFLDMGAMGAGVYDRLIQTGHSIQGVSLDLGRLPRSSVNRRSEMWE